YGLKGNLHVPSFCARRTRTCPGVHHMNLLTPPALHAPLDAVEQADPIVRGPEKPVEAQDDSVQLAPAPGGAGGDSLEVHGLGLTLADGRRLLSDVSLSAIIGPSGAGKSTLAKLVAGALTPTAGEVCFGGHDLHTEYPALRHRVGLVPQDDVVHHQLTVAAALRYAAELRLPQASAQQQDAAVTRVLEELELTGHAHTRVDRLSGGQRKRASVAMELLT